jgi:DNA-binding transcriptional ArsR family regulator
MDAQVIMQSPGGAATAKPIHLVDDPADLDAISSALAWKILEALKTEPDFPGSIAKKLHVHEQKVYYHIRRLAAAGMLKVVRQEQRRGGLCRYYAPVADAFGVQLHGKGTPVTTGPGAAPAKLREFLGEFSRDGILDSYVVVGSPHPHGPFLTVARDSPYAVQLGLRLGQLFAPPKGLSVRLDTEVKAEGLERSNMMLVGGPVANIVSMDANEHLKVRFEWQDAWKIQSSITGRTYSEEYSGLIAKVPNPWRAEKKMLLLWGLHYVGTLAAILGVTQLTEKVMNDYHGEAEFYKVVLGLDRDGDGKLDDVSILE